MDLKSLGTKVSSKWRILLIVFVPFIMIFVLAIMLSSRSVVANNGMADLSNIDFSHNKLVSLDGQWEFYWNKLLRAEDFNLGQRQKIDSFMKVPGIWSHNAGTHYTSQGKVTYRLSLYYPKDLKDPALRIQNVANAYKLYVNGELMAEVGSSLDNKAKFKNDDKIIIIDLPKNTQKIELVFQVGNLNCATGGLRIAPVFGSRQVLEHQRMIMIMLQMFFIGGVLIFGIHYFSLFLLQKGNRTALFFSIICLTTALRSMIWGETSLTILFPSSPLDMRIYINYLTGYNYVAILIMFVYSLYPLEFNKKVMGLILLPSLIFDVFLLTTNPEFMTFYTNYLYILLILQMIYIMGALMKSVLRKRDNAVLMFIAICVLIWAIYVDIIDFVLIGSISLSYMTLLGNFAVILAMSHIQAKQQARNHEKLILYNEKLLEADKLKDQIMATEMSFLQAQIKPHFLYNALSAIANVCEKDGKQASKLIIDLAFYLRGSLEFNNLDKMVSVEKELQFVDTYFHIEQARFGQKIQLNKEIEIPLDVQMPILILQPLVENAVRHGISKKFEGGTVTVRMIQKDGNVYIEIEDDGVGINSDKLAMILCEQDNVQGVGLLNIHNRLLKLYGIGLEISSEPGHTSVKLLITEGVL
ncbi:histidine kinase [Clostridium sp. PL3]|uniref:Histidine kinase n=1 Tax=Clostridium thailandense TaxID=2794346 RepID=A0A949WUR7_9CLOT|nr:histidine kinase [Clostridium thailandense]MBV7272872.1 histidine kinase [Clostridium thailandense]